MGAGVDCSGQISGMPAFWVQVWLDTQIERDSVADPPQQTQPINTALLVQPFGMLTKTSTFWPSIEQLNCAVATRTTTPSSSQSIIIRK